MTSFGVMRDLAWRSNSVVVGASLRRNKCICVCVIVVVGCMLYLYDRYPTRSAGNIDTALTPGSILQQTDNDRTCLLYTT